MLPMSRSFIKLRYQSWMMRKDSSYLQQVMGPSWHEQEQEIPKYPLLPQIVKRNKGRRWESLEGNVEIRLFLNSLGSPQRMYEA
jgi:hypothetical protein